MINTFNNFLKGLIIGWVFIKILAPTFSLQTNPDISTSYGCPFCYKRMHFLVFDRQNYGAQSCAFNNSILIWQFPKKIRNR